MDKGEREVPRPHTGRERLELGGNIYGQYRSIFNHCDVFGQQSNQIRCKKEKGLLRRSRSFKVIEIGTNRKPVYDFLSVINSNWQPNTVAELLQLIVQILDILRFWATLWGFQTIPSDAAVYDWFRVHRQPESADKPIQPITQTTVTYEWATSFLLSDVLLEMCGNGLQHSHSLPFPSLHSHSQSHSHDASDLIPIPVPWPEFSPIPIPVWLINNIYHWIIKRW